MVKTAIENRQDLVIEGCYIAFTWQIDFSSEYLKDIRYLCLALSESYINKHFGLIKDKANVIENRRSDDLDKTQLIEETVTLSANVSNTHFPYSASTGIEKAKWHLACPTFFRSRKPSLPTLSHKV